LRISVHFLKIHLAVLLFGFSGLFGKWVQQPAYIIVLGRLFFAVCGLGIFGFFKKGALQRFKEIKNRKVLIWSGLLLGFHWVTFFESIRLSSVGIGLLTFSTFPVFTSLLEPLLLGTALHRRNVLVSLIAFSGVLIMISEIEINTDYFLGALIGIISGLTFAFLTIYNRKNLVHINAVTLSFYQDSVALVFLLPFLFLIEFKLGWTSIMQLAALGLIFTALAHTLFIAGMKSVTATSASLTTFLEPVYGMAGAWLFFNELPSNYMLIGGILIFLAIGMNLKEKVK
jgi:drug/metabolite transporter (DMT)-like permease